MMNGKQGKQRQYDLEERLINFCIQILDLVDALPHTRVGNHIAGQLVRCGTSPAANYAEAQSAESRSDFIHKMKVILNRDYLRTPSNTLTRALSHQGRGAHFLMPSPHRGRGTG